MSCYDVSWGLLNTTMPFMQRFDDIQCTIMTKTNPGEPEIDTICDGKYKLVKTKYDMKDPKYWSCYTLDILDNMDHTIYRMFRNYHTLKYVVAMQNGHPYIITSADYQSIAIIDLDNQTIKYFGEWGRIRIGAGWCPTDFYWDEEDNKLELEGCYWGGCYDKAFFEIPDLSAVTTLDGYISEDWYD